MGLPYSVAVRGEDASNPNDKKVNGLHEFRLDGITKRTKELVGSQDTRRETLPRQHRFACTIKRKGLWKVIGSANNAFQPNARASEAQSSSPWAAVTARNFPLCMSK